MLRFLQCQTYRYFHFTFYRKAKGRKMFRLFLRQYPWLGNFSAARRETELTAQDIVCPQQLLCRLICSVVHTKFRTIQKKNVRFT